MKWLWTYGGKCFGYFTGEDVWTYTGKHMGKLHDHEIYGTDGAYVGEIIKGDQLITNLAKTAWRRHPFTPDDRQGGYPKYGDYAGYAMYAGHEDFPPPESF